MSPFPGELYPGFVYFIEGAGMVKIGFTESVERRLADLQSMCPVPLSLLAVVPGNNATENSFHRFFRAYRAHGEWFHLRGALAAHIQQGPDLNRLCEQAAAQEQIVKCRFRKQAQASKRDWLAIRSDATQP